VGLKTLFGWLTWQFGLPMHNWDIGLPGAISSYVTWLTVVLSSIDDALIRGCGVVITFMLLNQLVKNRYHHTMIIAVMLILILSIRLGNIGNWTTGETLWMTTKVAITIIFGYLAFRAWAVGRLHAVIATVLITGLMGEGLGLSRMGESSYQMQGWILVAIGAILFGALVYSGFVNSKIDENAIN
jgi:hypothetical protein